MSIQPPAHLGLELTSKCQAKCIGCPQPVMERRGRDMPLALALRVVREAADLGVKMLLPHHFGEPTLSRDLPEILRAGHEAGLKVRMYTNGSMLHREDIRAALLDYVDDLVFSVDGATAESMQRARPGLDPEEIFGKVENYLGIPNRQRVTVRMTAFDFSAHEAEAFKARWKAAGAEVVAVVNDLRHAPPRDESKPCTQPFDHMSVLVDGRVALCCRDFFASHTLGDLSLHSLREIWEGPRAEFVRRMHLAGESAVIPVCNGCTRAGEWDPETGKVKVKR